MKCDQFNDFYEHDHGYVFDRQQLESVINQIRQQAFREAVVICRDLADLTVNTEHGNAFKQCYNFAMDRIRDHARQDQE